ncbi:asparagine synthase C-terminal domain-containing protein, partial [Xanthomonas hortorum pv. hederae]
SARNGQTPKIQTRLSATTRHSALSGRVIQTFPKHVRIPLLSQPVMEACLRVPTWMCVSEGKNRSVARAAFADAIPHDVLNRRSKGSYLNFAGVVYKENRVQLRGFLMSGCLRSQGLLDVTALEEFFQRDFPPRDFSFLRIFYLCMFENWLRHQD